LILNLFRASLSHTKLTHEMIQESIDAFAFDLRENQKEKFLKTAPLNYFMGILRRGIPYTPPANYKSPQEKALEEFIQSKQKRQEERKKLEAQALDLASEEWLSSLTGDEKATILLQESDKDTWKKCLQALKSELPPQDFETWVKPLRVVQENDEWVIFAPNRFVSDHIEKSFFSKMKEFLGKFIIKVGEGGNVAKKEEVKGSYGEDISELKRYFKSMIWPEKQKELLPVG
jgi:hypothetical protein